MKRRGFINMAVFLPLISSFRSIFRDDELLRFDLAQLDPLLKNLSPGDLAKANLLKKNLAFDVQYVLERIKGLDDLEKIKSLALEADKKFYADSKLTAASFVYQPISISELERFRNPTAANVKEFDGMMKDIRVQLGSLQGSGEAYVKETVNKLAGIGPQKYMRTPPVPASEQPKRERTLLTGIQEQPKAGRKVTTTIEEQPNHTELNKAKEAQECAKTWMMVGCFVLIVIAIVVAILITIKSFDSGDNAAALAATASILGAATLSSQVISVTSNEVKIDNTNIGLRDAKVELNKVNLDSLLKCATSAAAVTAAMSYFGKTSYPANPLAASLTVSLIGIVGKIPGFDACS